jgi:Tol biopolymer transport system component/tRNA A-37 threonylcarbamoyl transferase component Bud32
MSLASGTRLGSYEIISLIGAGGMGEVYRARDAKLKRDVAIKILTRELNGNAEALARFEREAHAVAALADPNIVAIFDFGVEGGQPYAVTELLQGETLRERFSTGGTISRRETLAYAVQIADGLSAAHEKGLVHRDLKPENIFITTENRVKILDFGLAKQSSAFAGHDVATERLHTRPGSVAGTVAYMSPEQVRGAELDTRSDVFSFGTVLYEMLTTERPFQRDSAAETMTAIVREEPPDLLDPSKSIPPSVARIVTRCLAKRPAERFQSSRDLAFALRSASDGESARSTAVVAASMPARRRWIAPALAGAILAAVATAAVLLFGRSRTAAPMRTFQLPIERSRFGFDDPATISPDGSKLAYVDRGQLKILRLDTAEAANISVATEVDDGSASLPVFFWSADGANLAFSSGHRLWRVPSTGGTPSAICDIPDSGAILGGDWDRDDHVLFSAWRGSLYQVPAGGGRPEAVLRLNPEKEVDFHSPRYLPDHAGILFIPHDRDPNSDSVSYVAGGKRVAILQVDSSLGWSTVKYDPAGYLLLERRSEEGVWVAPFSIRDMRVAAPPYLAVREGSSPSVAADGTLVFVSGAFALPASIVRVAPDGKATSPMGIEGRDVASPVLSPDGQRMAVTMIDASRKAVWVYDVARGARLRVTSGSGDSYAPAWSHSGKKLFFIRMQSPLHASISSVSSGGGDEQPFPESSSIRSVEVSPDARWLVYSADLGGGRCDVRIAPLDANEQVSGSAHTLFSGILVDSHLRVAPQGDLIAYASDADQLEVFVHSFPVGTDQQLISTQGGRSPVWSRNGDRLFFLSGDDMMMQVDVRRTPSLSFGAPRKLFSLREQHIRPASDFEVTPEGQFLMVREDGEATKIVIVINGEQRLRSQAK